MTEQEFRDSMNAARREGGLFWVEVEGEAVCGIAVGLDGRRGVAILHGGYEVALDDIRICEP